MLNIEYLATLYPEADEFNFINNTFTWTSMTYWGVAPRRNTQYSARDSGHNPVVEVFKRE